jgi:hypothetical protein
MQTLVVRDSWYSGRTSQSAKLGDQSENGNSYLVTNYELNVNPRFPEGSFAVLYPSKGDADRAMATVLLPVLGFGDPHANHFQRLPLLSLSPISISVMCLAGIGADVVNTKGGNR